VANQAGSAKVGSAWRGGRVAAALLLFMFASVLAWWQQPYASVVKPQFVETLLYPVESNSANRLPTIVPNLVSVAMSADGQRVVAIGDGGVILTSTNGGQDWVTRTSGTTAELSGVSLSANGERVAAVGSDGVILTSDNGGKDWAARTSGTTAQLNGVSFSADGERAVVVGSDGVILTSSNGGRDWITQTSGTMKSIFDVSLSSDGQGALAVGYGVILTSRNGGEDWTSHSIGNRMQVSDISLSADGQRAVAVTPNGEILTSSNGGQDWATQTIGTAISQLPSNTIVQLGSVSLSADGRHAVAVGVAGLILISDNGGQMFVSGGWAPRFRDFGECGTRTV